MTPYILILGIAQDAGYPQINCKKKCCRHAWQNISLHKSPTCIAIIDPENKQQWIIDATPKIKNQMQVLQCTSKINKIDGILLTHAHIGHYTGLMYLGKEALCTTKMPVYAMPKMKFFLKNNGPWNQLVKLNNIDIHNIKNNLILNLNNNIKIIPFIVNHRNEFSETVGFKIISAKKSIIFLPDIDRFDNRILDLIYENDILLLDATFYHHGETERNISEISHPIVKESMQLFSKLDKKSKSKVYFIHFNHTNPLLIKKSAAQKEVLKNGFNLAKEKQIIKL